VAGWPLSGDDRHTATQQVVAQFRGQRQYCALGTYVKAFGWPETGAVGTGYTATLRATVNGAAADARPGQLLDHRAAVQLNVSLAGLKAGARSGAAVVQAGEDDGRDDHAHDQEPRSRRPRLGAQRAGDAVLPRQKSAFLASYLTGLGVSYQIRPRTTFHGALSAAASTTPI